MRSANAERAASASLAENHHLSDSHDDRSTTPVGNTTANEELTDEGSGSAASSGRDRKRPRTNMPHQCDVGRFWRRLPEDWSLAEYLRHQRSDCDPRTVLSRYNSTLCKIQRCTECFNDSERARASKLISNYKATGRGSDRHLARAWSEEQRERRMKSTTFHTGPVYYGDISNNAPIGSVGTASSIGTFTAPNSVAESSLLSASNALESVDSQREDEADESNDSDATQPGQLVRYDFNRKLKWVLASGRSVEDILLEHAASDGSVESMLARSLIVDITNKKMSDWFSEEEWDEICACMPRLPVPDQFLVDSLKRFNGATTTAQLRHIVRHKPYIPEDTPYDPEVHFEAEWAHAAILNLLMLLEAKDEPLRRDNHAEDWFSMNLWSNIIDRCFLDISGMTVERKELSCLATTSRKNRDRTATGKGNHLKRGPRFDGVIRSIEADYYEYGAMEVGRVYKGTTSSKWITDAQKLVRSLRDMLRRLHETVDEQSTGKLQVVGFMTQGLSCQTLRMTHPKGYVCLLKREDVLKVPMQARETFKFLVLLSRIAQAKAVVKECMHLVKNPPLQDFEELLQESKKSEKSEKSTGVLLPWADTPSP